MPNWKGGHVNARISPLRTVKGATVGLCAWESYGCWKGEGSEEEGGAAAIQGRGEEKRGGKVGCSCGVRAEEKRGKGCTYREWPEE